MLNSFVYSHFSLTSSVKSDSIVLTCYELIDSTCDIYWASINSIIYEPFGLGRFATDHSLTLAASRPLFARVRRYAPQKDH